MMDGQKYFDNCVQNDQTFNYTRTKIFCFFENLAANYLTISSLHSADKCLNELLIFELNQSNFFHIFSPVKLPRVSASGKRIGRPPKKGTHVEKSSLLSPGKLEFLKLSTGQP